MDSYNPYADYAPPTMITTRSNVGEKKNTTIPTPYDQLFELSSLQSQSKGDVQPPSFAPVANSQNEGINRGKKEGEGDDYDDNFEIHMPLLHNDYVYGDQTSPSSVTTPTKTNNSQSNHNIHPSYSKETNLRYQDAVAYPSGDHLDFISSIPNLSKSPSVTRRICPHHWCDLLDIIYSLFTIALVTSFVLSIVKKSWEPALFPLAMVFTFFAIGNWGRSLATTLNSPEKSGWTFRIQSEDWQESASDRRLAYIYRCCCCSDFRQDIEKSELIPYSQFQTEYVNRMNEEPKLKLELISRSPRWKRIVVWVPITHSRNLSTSTKAPKLPFLTSVAAVSYKGSYVLAEEQRDAVDYLKKRLVDKFEIESGSTTPTTEWTIEETFYPDGDDSSSGFNYRVHGVYNFYNDILGYLCCFNPLMGTLMICTGMHCFSKFYWSLSTETKMKVKIIKAIQIGAVPEDLC